MNIKNSFLYLIVYSFIVLSVPLFFNSTWLKELPAADIYSGVLEFSGSNTLKDLEILTKKYPSRAVGSENALASAKWIEERFRELGLNTSKEEFICWNFREDISRSSLSDFFNKEKGLNVIGTSKGTSEEIIIIGAHRDVLGTIEGAQDNATGTAAILELARVLTSKEHYYTYMFVSFDAEEIGLVGSEHFVKNNPNLKIKLAMILDCVGYKHADTVGFYQFVNGKGSSPLWSVSLAQTLMKDRSLPMYYLDSDGGFSPLSINLFNPLLNKLLSQRIAGDVNTDTGPFVDRSIPSIGFIAAKTGEVIDPEGVFHTHNDVMTYVSVDTIDMIGKFAEQYIMSLNLNGFEGELNSNYYLIFKDKYLSRTPIAGFMIFITLMFILLWAISCVDVFKNIKPFISFLKKESKWLLSILLLSIVSGFYLMLLKLQIFFDIPLLVFFLSWFLISSIGIITILSLRFIYAARLKKYYDEVTRHQRMLMNTIYIIAYLLISIFYNVFAAAVLMALPIMLMGRVGFRSIGVRITWGIIFLIWSIIQTGIFIICLQPYIFGLLSFKTGFLVFINTFVWCTTFIYIISSPAIPKRNMNIQRSDNIGNNNWSY